MADAIFPVFLLDEPETVEHRAIISSFSDNVPAGTAQEKAFDGKPDESSAATGEDDGATSVPSLYFDVAEQAEEAAEPEAAAAAVPDPDDGDDLVRRARVIRRIREIFPDLNFDMLRDENLREDWVDEFIRMFDIFDGEEGTADVDSRPIGQCRVCLEDVRLGRRPCCGEPVCDGCLRAHVETQLTDLGNVRIGCPIPGCDRAVFQEDVRELLRTTPELRERYDRWLVDLNGDPRRKTCPRCCLITELNDEDGRLTADRKVAKYGLQVECAECRLEWCFPCQAPWHAGQTCKQYRAGDVLLREWAHKKSRDQRNAQRCPKCKFYIQRSSGCDHMQCSRCNTKFCYRCGARRLHGLALFGVRLEDHDMKHSIIGCKDKYKPGRPVQRVLGRTAILGSKIVAGVIAAPVVVGLLAGAAGLAVGVGAAALPFYGCYRLALLVKQEAHKRRLRQTPVRIIGVRRVDYVGNTIGVHVVDGRRRRTSSALVRSNSLPVDLSLPGASRPDAGETSARSPLRSLSNDSTTEGNLPARTIA